MSRCGRVGWLTCRRGSWLACLGRCCCGVILLHSVRGRLLLSVRLLCVSCWLAISLLRHCVGLAAISLHLWCVTGCPVLRIPYWSISGRLWCSVLGGPVSLLAPTVSSPAAASLLPAIPRLAFGFGASGSRNVYGLISAVRFCFDVEFNRLADTE